MGPEDQTDQRTTEPIEANAWDIVNPIHPKEVCQRSANSRTERCNIHRQMDPPRQLKSKGFASRPALKTVLFPQSMRCKPCLLLATSSFELHESKPFDGVPQRRRKKRHGPEVESHPTRILHPFANLDLSSGPQIMTSNSKPSASLK